MMTIQKVELADMLACREARAMRQKELLKQHTRPVVSIGLNIAGDVQNPPAICLLQQDAEQDFKAAAKAAGFVLLSEERSDAFTGPHSLLVYDAPQGKDADALASSLKEIGVRLEEETPWGRLFDIDILAADGEKLSRSNPRRCIVCGGPAADCARSRAHGLEQVKKASDALLAQYLGDSLGTQAASALVREAGLTPKPGLVDAANNGAHRDMDLQLLLASASAIRPFFAQMAGFSAAYGKDIDTLIRIGINAEKAMFEATKGVNTHKGAIFAFSLCLAAAADCLMQGGDLIAGVQMLAAQKAQKAAPSALTHGDAVRAAYAAFSGEGALAEACKGFPMAVLAARTMRESGDAFLALCRVMSRLADSNVLYRGGEEGLHWLQGEASRLCNLNEEERTAGLRDMDAVCIERNISPGGAADMLALGMFLAELPLAL